MISFSERVALFRIGQYLGAHRPFVATVTGTYGRTIASQALYHAIAQHRHVRIGFDIEREKVAGLKNFLIKSKMQEIREIEPDTIINTLPLERPGYALYVASKLLPRLLVISNIGLEHIDFFGSKDMIAHEYLAVANSLAQDACVVLNADDEYVRDLQQHINHPVITYGMHESADVRLMRAERQGKLQGIVLEFLLHGVHYEGHFPHIISKQHVAGVLAGLAGAHAMGVDMHDAIASVQQLKAPHGSFSMHPGINNSTIIDDTADACPEKIESSLKSFSLLNPDVRKFVVLGDVDGLSQLSHKAHEEIGKLSVSAGSIVIFVGDMMRKAQATALQSGEMRDTHHFTSSADAATWLPEHIRAHDLLYVAGGKSMEMGKILGRLKASIELVAPRGIEPLF